jgi:hypothetical protein
VQPAELPALLSTLTPTVNRLPTLSRRLRKLFPLVTPVSDCVRDRVVPMLTTKINDGNLSTNRPVWQDLAHATVGLAGASQNFDANGPNVRYLAAAGDSTIATGSLPGIGRLVSLGPQIKGSTPQWLGNGNLPPFRPDVACRDATPVNLQSRTPFGAGATRSAQTARSTSSRLASRAIGVRDGSPSTLRDALRTVAGAVDVAGGKR